MRILITADLHYDILRSREPTQRMAADICAAGGDALVLVGDSAGAALGPLQECLALFNGFVGRKLLVPGNHCLWCRPGENSLDRYERILPAVCRDAGFELLDHQPVVMGDVGLVGSIGWYDYSLADASLGIPEAFYRAKLTPGAAARMEEYRGLVEAHRAQLTERHMEMGIRWMDGVNVRLPFSDPEFTRRLADRLAAQLADLSPRCRQIIAFIHHLPFDELVPRGRPLRFAFAAAFMGSRRFGEVLLQYPKVTHVYSGHSHWPEERRFGRLLAVNVGSTYIKKRLKILEV